MPRSANLPLTSCFLHLFTNSTRVVTTSPQSWCRILAQMMSRPRPGRSRMFLTLQLAVVLPAAALIAFSVWSLHSIHRDRAVEAAMQRDFSRVLEITEKRLNEKARRMVEEARPGLPCPSEHAGDKLEE